jgi:DNA repair protein RecN (Recombination protein N)
MLAELNALEAHDERLAELGQKLALANIQVKQAAHALSDSRKAAAKKLSPLVKKEIADLGMPQAVFEVELSFDAESPTASGADTLRVLFSANLGESPNALEKVASGGELSRVMLAIKRVLMTKDTTMVSIFDEVDAGVGGAIGHAIGEKLKAISRGRQVLCVTHLAQVAALADAHLKVEKSVVKGRTFSSLQKLDRPQRVDELARMMGGREVTELTRKHAHEFLEQAEVSL